MISQYKIFSRQEILAKKTQGRCVNCSLSPVSQLEGLSIEIYYSVLHLHVCIYSDLEEVANSVKNKPTHKFPDIQYKSSHFQLLNVSTCS